MSTILDPAPRTSSVGKQSRRILGRSIVTLLGPAIVGLGWMTMPDPAQATVTATESGGVLTVTIGAAGDNPTLSTTTSGGNIHVNGVGFTGDFAGVTQIHINLAQNGETPTFDSTNFSFNAPVTITDTGGTGGDSITKNGAHNLTVTGVSSYGSGTGINGGTLLVNNGSALGTGLVVVGVGAELRGVGTLTMANVISLPSGGTGTISTAGTFTISDLSMQGDVNFGSTGNAGTVVVASNPGSVSSSASIDVAFGTLRNGGGLSFYTGGAGATSVNTGATLSVNDLSMTVADLFGAGAVTLGTKAATLLTLNAGNFSGVISGAGQVQFTGGSTLSGTNTYTGGTTISGGTLAIGNGGTTGSVAGNIVDNSALVFVRSNAVTYGGVISGTGAVTQGGSGVLSLTGNNTYSGGTTVHSGVLSFNNAQALGTGGVTLDTGAELRGSGTVTLGNTVKFAPSGFSTLSTNGTLMVNSLYIDGASTQAVFGSVGNAGVVVVGVGGSISVSSTATMEVAFGTLRNGGALGNYTGTAAETNISAGATLSVNDINMDIAELAGAGSVALGTKASTVLTLDGASFNGVISGAGQVNIINKDATLGATDTYTGGTTITSGRLQLGTVFANGTVTGNIVNNGTLIFGEKTAVTYNGILSGTGAVSQGSFGVVTLGGNNTYSGGTTVNFGTLAISNGNALGSGLVLVTNGAEIRATGTMTVPNIIRFNGDSTISTSGTLTVSRLDLEGTSTSFGSPGNAGTIVLAPTGPSAGDATGNAVHVAFGTVKDGGGLNFYTSLNYLTSVDAGATLDLNDHSDTIKYLGGNGSVKLGASAATVLSLDNANFAGVISGAGQVSMPTGGAMIFTGANTYTGGTTVSNGGELEIGADSTTGSVAGNIFDNAQLNFSRTNALTYGGIISGTGLVKQTGSGVLTLTGVNTYTGGTTVESGVLSFNNAKALGTGGVTLDTGTELRSSGTVTLANMVNFATTFSSTLSTNGILTVSNMNLPGVSTSAIFGSAGNAGVVVVVPGGTVNMNPAASLEVAFGTLRNGGALGYFTSSGGPTTIDPGATLSVNDQDMIVAHLSGFGTVNLGTKATTHLTVDGGFFFGVISGAGQVSFPTANLVVLTGANTYTGGTTINGGGLQIGDSLTTGSIVGNVVDNALLNFARSNAVTFGGIISGTGGVQQVGTGVLTLTGNNTYSGETTIQSGVLSINNAHALGTGGVFLDPGTELRSSGTVTLVNSVDFATNGSSTLSTSGTLTVSNMNLFGGSTNAIFGSAGNTGVVVVSGASDVAQTSTIEVAFGTLRNGGGLGFYTANGGATTVNAGATLSVNDQSMTVIDLHGAGAVTLGTKAATVLTLGGGVFAGVISGAGQVNCTGSVVLYGANTYTGGTTISGGTLQIGNGNTTGSVVGNIVDNGTLTFARSNAMTYAGIISGAGAVRQSGSGVLTLTGNNTYTGGTTLTDGTMLVNNTAGSGTGTSGVAVSTGATLGGKGTIAGVITVNNSGILAPGAGTPGVPGTKLHTASVVWNGGGTFEFQLGATADELVMSGTLIKNTAGAYTIDLLKAGTLAQNYTLMTFTGTNFIASDFTLELPTGYTATLIETSTSLSLTSLVHGEEPAAGGSPTPRRSEIPDGLTSSFSPGSDSAADPGLSVSPAPEPGSAALLAFGGAALLGWWRRR